MIRIFALLAVVLAIVVATAILSIVQSRAKRKPGTFAHTVRYIYDNAHHEDTWKCTCGFETPDATSAKAHGETAEAWR